MSKPLAMLVVVRQVRSGGPWTATCGRRKWGRWSQPRNCPTEAASEAVVLYVRHIQRLDVSGRRLPGDPIGYAHFPATDGAPR